MVLSVENTVSRVFRIQKATTIIGRSFESDVWIDDASISRRHAQLEALDDGFRVVDLNSKNGTFVNNENVRERMLKEDDRIQVGLRTVLVFTYDVDDDQPTR
jgi:pSer/pThr/pTyr-binding forkhead associated (FHA) protein